MKPFSRKSIALLLLLTGVIISIQGTDAHAKSIPDCGQLPFLRGITEEDILHITEDSSRIALATVLPDYVGQAPVIIPTRYVSPYDRSRQKFRTTFELVEAIKGEVPERFKVPHSRPPPEVTTHPTLNGRGPTRSPTLGKRPIEDHRSLDFWLGQDAFCGAVWPVFEIGKTYLLFLDHGHSLAFEEIESSEDFWLRAVREAVQTGSLTTWKDAFIEFLLGITSLFSQFHIDLPARIG